MLLDRVHYTNYSTAVQYSCTAVSREHDTVAIIICNKHVMLRGCRRDRLPGCPLPWMPPLPPTTPEDYLAAASTDSESDTALYTWMAATVRPCTHPPTADLIGSLETVQLYFRNLVRYRAFPGRSRAFPCDRENMYRVTTMNHSLQ